MECVWQMSNFGYLNHLEEWGDLKKPRLMTIFYGMSQDTIYNILKLMPLVALLVLATVFAFRGFRNKPHGDKTRNIGGGASHHRGL